MVVRGPEKRSTGQQRKRSIIPENDRSCAQFLIAQRGKWQATITRLNKFSFLFFSSEEDAARAYDRLLAITLESSRIGTSVIE